MGAGALCRFAAQHERARVVRRLAEDARRRGSGTAEQLLQRAESYREGADLLRRLLGRTGRVDEFEDYPLVSAEPDPQTP